MKCLPRETASELCYTYMSMHEIQWLFMGVFNYYILQLRSQRASFDKASYFMLACVSVKWEWVRLIDRGSVEMMHFPCDCFHSHYSQHRVISRPAADTSSCACATQTSQRRVRLPLPQHWSLIAGLNQWAKIMDYVHSHQSGCQGKRSQEGRTAAVLFMKAAGGLLEILLAFCLLDVIVLPVKGILGETVPALTLASLCMPSEREQQWQSVSLTLHTGDVYWQQPDRFTPLRLFQEIRFECSSVCVKIQCFADLLDWQLKSNISLQVNYSFTPEVFKLK